MILRSFRWCSLPLLWILACRGDGADDPPAAAPDPTPSADATAKVVETKPEPEPTEPEPTEPEPTEPEPAEPDPATDEPDPDAPSLSYVDRKCAACEDALGRRCVTQTHPDGRAQALGCGEASPVGNYALTVREKGSIDDGTWVADFLYFGPQGELKVVNEACTEEPGFYCQNPGRFIALEDGRWIHHMGNAGDGSNDQAIADLVSGERFELPIGEYPLATRADGLVAGFLSTVPNLYTTKDGSAAIRATAGCFDVRTKKVHAVWTADLPEDDDEAESYYHGDAKWDGETLVLHDMDGKSLRRLACPPTTATPGGAGNGENEDENEAAP